MDPAAFASLRQPVTVTAGPVKIVVEPQDIRVWLASRAEQIPLFELLEYDDAMEVSELRYAGEVDEVALRDGWRNVLAAQSGMDWWAAERLLVMLENQWDMFAGDLASNGVDALSLPLDQALFAGVAMVRKGLDKKDWRRFEQDLYAAPPAQVIPGVRTPPPGWDDSKNEQMWMQVAATRTPGLRRSAVRA